MNFSTAPFVSRFDTPLGAGDGPLKGLRVAVKDNFDIAGHVAGCGNPEWASTHSPAETTAPLVAQLLGMGAKVVGKTQMDELAYSLMGQNARYGTPVNPVTPDRMPGGSSSGSAVAVGSGAVEIGLGTDTGGSVRVPAAFCALFGWRPTHGLLSAEGIVPLAQSYDVPGFMTRDAATLALLASVFSPESEAIADSPFFPEDVWNVADRELAEILLPAGQKMEAELMPATMRDLLLPTFRVCQGAEVAETFREWIAENQPLFGPGIQERFQGAMALTETEIALANKNRMQIREYLSEAITERGVIALPTVPGPAPLLSLKGQAMESYRNRTLTLQSLAGHAGLPQVTIPRFSPDGLPLGLSLIGPPNSDRALIHLASKLHQEMAEA